MIEGTCDPAVPCDFGLAQPATKSPALSTSTGPRNACWPAAEIAHRTSEFRRVDWCLLMMKASSS